MGDYEFILEMSDCSGGMGVPCVWYITAEGGHLNTVGDSEWHAVRPTFYLNSNVTYVSGSGTQTDPYRIA